MNLLYIKALHIIFVVTWFAGLFYIVRLFIYHTEAEDKSVTEKEILQAQFKIMERRLWFGITWPSAILTIILGSWLVYEMYGWEFVKQPWLILKLSLVLLLLLYHFSCHTILKKLQSDIIKYSSAQLRIWNEAATVFLVSIVFIVVLKDTISFVWGLVGLAIFTLVLLVAISIYKRARKKSENKG